MKIWIMFIWMMIQKDGVQTKLEEFIGEKVDCRIHEEEIYN